MAKTKTKKESHQFGAEVGKVLNLVINSIYQNKDIFLRELISNASDACDKLKFEALQNQTLLEGDTDIKISVTLDKKAGTITITDSGIGMNHDELINNLGTIAKSGTEEFMKNIGDKASAVELIGQFGVGFYSSFMVASDVRVESKKAGETEAWLWESKGDGEFTVSPLKAEDAPIRGTRIVLTVKSEESEYLDWFKLEHIIKTYSDHIAYPIYFSQVSDNPEIEEDREPKIINSASAIWARPKSEITPEQYKEFYKHTAHAVDDPWLIIHNKNEGVIEYTNLLFIPTQKPFDLFHPDRIRRVKLYVKRVFITDEAVDLIPHYMRFLRGIVDCEDLPLNVSRETLQHNAIVEKIKSGITKRVIADLAKKLAKDAESYDKFWENFGAALKEGLCEATAPREDLLAISRFNSTKSKESLTSIDDYIGRMKADQPEIYYVTADSVEEAMKNPVLSGFIKNDVEVLIFTDHVDDFWVNVISEYKGKKLNSVTRSDASLEWLGDNKVAGDEVEAKADDAPVGDISTLVTKLKSIYGDQVADVKISSKLLDTPAMLSVSEHGMDIRMERFLYEQKQLKMKSAKILEINPNHAVIKRLQQLEESGSDAEQLESLALITLDQARIIAGDEIPDTIAFCGRLNKYILKAA